MARKYDGSKQRELDQRLIGLTPEAKGRRRLQALTSKCEKFPAYMKPREMQELKELQAAWPQFY